MRVGPLSETVNKIFTFSINKTCHQINPDKSHHKVKSDYLLVFLAKHNPGSDWSHITFAEKVTARTVCSLTGLSLPLSLSPQVAADNKKKADEPKMDDKADPSAGLMNVSQSGLCCVPVSE